MKRVLITICLLAAVMLHDSTGAPPIGREIGQTAPEIIGTDINGKPLKLSNFRGRVVVLDFWGDW